MRREARELKKLAKLDKQRERQNAQASRAIEPDPRRVPQFVESPEADDFKLQWCFELFDANTDWRLNPSDDHEPFVEVGRHLKSYSSMSWKDIKSNSHRDHAIAVGDLCKRAKDRLVVLKQDDAEELWRLRFGSTQRLWGVRIGHIMRLIWWDPDHQVYPTEPRNT